MASPTEVVVRRGEVGQADRSVGVTFEELGNRPEHERGILRTPTAVMHRGPMRLLHVHPDHLRWETPTFLLYAVSDQACVARDLAPELAGGEERSTIDLQRPINVSIDAQLTEHTVNPGS